jgi:hypothetical protein
MSLLCLAFELFQLFSWDSQGLVLACVEIKAQDFNENRVGLVDANGEINGGLLGVETKWVTLGVENSRSKEVSKSQIFSLHIRAKPTLRAKCARFVFPESTKHCE